MRKLVIAVVLAVGCAFLRPANVRGQIGRGAGPWTTPGASVQLTGWQHEETRITPDNAKNIRLLWKLKLAASEDSLPVPTEPLYADGVITEKGFKDMAIILGPGENLYSVDYELGRMIWRKHFDIQQAARTGACPDAQFSSVVLQPPPVFRFRPFAPGPSAPGPQRGAAPVISQPAPPVARRRVGASSGGGLFSMRGVFVLTSDGYLHEQILSNGADYAPAVKFLSGRNAEVSDITIGGSTMYVNTTNQCGGFFEPGGIWNPLPNGAWAMDMGTPAYKISSFDTGNMNIGGWDGPAQSTDGKTLYVVTGSEPADASSGNYPNSVVALDAKTMQVKDYYTPVGADASGGSNTDVSPVVFAYKGRDLVADYGTDARLVLLDSASLGGADHHTPLAITQPIAANRGGGAWGRLASATDKNGIRWIFVSLHGPVGSSIHFPMAHGPTPDGCIVAFQVEDQGGKTALTPAWVSPDIVNPSPAVIANGLVFDLGNGEASESNARLFALDMETGAPLYSSGDEITSPAYFSSISVSLGHVIFLAEDDMLYSFGIGIKH